MDLQSGGESGVYIALEGIDGTGKSTLARRIGEENPGWFITCEPRSLDRTVLAGTPSPMADVLLFAADRVEQMLEVSRYLGEGRTVVSDRTFYSSMAYQSTSLCGVFGGLENAMNWIEMVNKPFLIYPDVVILLDIPASTSTGRMEGRPGKTRFEKEKYLEEVRQTYLLMAKTRDFHVVDARSSLEEVMKKVLEICSG